jgi:hypothetical protein
MPRPRLTDTEREAKRKARAAFTFSDAAYKHYDPAREGYGSADEWIAAAEALAGGNRGFFKSRPNQPRINPDLVTLMLEEMPSHIDGLKKAFKNALFLHHPDFGGTNEACRNVLTAFERLSKLY